MSENEKKLEGEEVFEEESKEKEERDFTLSFFSTGKWKKDQSITFLNFSSLDDTISSIFKILAVVLLVLFFKKDSDK